MADIPLQYTNQTIGNPKKKSPALIIILLIVILVGGYFLLRKSNPTGGKKAKVEVTKEPTPTAKPAIDKITVKIEVQNGTGTPGQASNTAEILKNAGYNLDNILTANATNNNNTKTTISIKSGFEDIGADIKTSLEPTFSNVSINSTKLDSTNKFDVIIITGGKAFETATPSPTTAEETVTPTETPTATNTPTPTLTPTPTP